MPRPSASPESSSRAPSPGPAGTGVFAWMIVGLGVAALGSCSVIPDWSPERYVEYTLTAHYDGGRDEPRLVELPTSDGPLMILELEVGPEGLRQEYRAGLRCLHLPAGDDPARVHCRFRLYGEGFDDAYRDFGDERGGTWTGTDEGGGNVRTDGDYGTDGTNGLGGSDFPASLFPGADRLRLESRTEHRS